MFVGVYIINECDILFIGNRWTFPTALVFKIVVVQGFGCAGSAVLENGTMPVAGHARLVGVHAGPNAAGSGCARVLAQFAASGFQFGGFA